MSCSKKKGGGWSRKRGSTTEYINKSLLREPITEAQGPLFPPNEGTTCYIVFIGLHVQVNNNTGKLHLRNERDYYLELTSAQEGEDKPSDPELQSNRLVVWKE